MKIALAQINPTVGDIAGNAALIRRDIRQARDAGAQLVVFPELAIIGYPPKDLLLKPAAIGQCRAAVDELAEECTGIAAIIGLPLPSPEEGTGRLLLNAAAVCRDGRVVDHRIKSLLPTYDVFDESRYFEPGPGVELTTFQSEIGDLRLGISICEDLWNDERFFSRQLYHDNPIDELARRGADVMINVSASPFVVRKHGFRLKLMSHIAKRYSLPLVYCNQVGGNDELVFDGNSCAFDAGGCLIGHAAGFEEDLLIVDVPLNSDREACELGEEPRGGGGRVVFDVAASASASRAVSARSESSQEKIGPTRAGSLDIDRYIQPPLEAAYHALVLGLRDYCRKCGFRDIVLGLSGGIDSALTCCIAVDALGPEHVRGITMPSRYSSSGSVSDSQVLADRLGITFHEVPIKEPHAAFDALLAPYFEGMELDATEENIQARVRGVILMAFSNKFGSLLVTTGNKSEMAVGYCTLYGDMAGGLAVLSDVPKTMVYDLSRWINENEASPLRSRFGEGGKEGGEGGAVIPPDTITKPPSAELRNDQHDQQSLPPYDVLDAIIERYVEREQSAARIIEETGYDEATVLRMVKLIDRNEYKRKQAAPGLKITGRAFGFGRRMPIAQRYDPRAAVEREARSEEPVATTVPE